MKKNIKPNHITKEMPINKNRKVHNLFLGERGSGMKKQSPLENIKAWSPKQKGKAAVLVALFAVLLVVGVSGVGYALNKLQEAPEAVKSVESTVETQAQESPVALTINIGGDEVELAAKAKVEVVDDKNGCAIEEREVEVNTKVELGKLSKGTYMLHITRAPAHIDGTTYILPEQATEFKVDGKGEAVDLEIELEVLPVDIMTNEQLEAVAEILEESGNAEVASNLREKAHIAVSEPDTAASVDQGSQVTNTGSNTENNGNAGNGSNGSENNGNSTNEPTPTPSDPNAGKTWYEATTHQEWVVTKAAWTEQIPILGSKCNGCGANITGNTEEHLKAAGRGSACQSYSGDVVVGYDTVNHPEEGYWKTVVDRPAGWY